MKKRRCIEGNLSFGPAFEAFKKGAIIGKESRGVLLKFKKDFVYVIRDLTIEDFLAEDWQILEEYEVKLPKAEELRRSFLPLDDPDYITPMDVSPEILVLLNIIGKWEEKALRKREWGYRTKTDPAVRARFAREALSIGEKEAEKELEGLKREERDRTHYGPESDPTAARGRGHSREGSWSHF